MRGQDVPAMSPPARERADRSVAIASALWGAIRLSDRIPTYRLHVCARLEGIDRLEPTWRTVLPEVLADAAGGGIVVDLRSRAYQAIGKPAGLGHRTVDLRVDQRGTGHRIGDVIAKRIRGQAARHLLESTTQITEPDAVASILAERWPVRLSGPEGPSKPWSLTVTAGD